MSHAGILAHFPNMVPGDLALTSPRTPTHNCIAYAAGDLRRWWWPDPDGIFYWPPTVQRVERLAVFQQAFEGLGYALCAGSGLVAGFQKIAIFAANSAPTHAARQLSSGLWSSKLGKMEDVSHNLAGMEGGTYGDVAFIMSRPVT